MRAASLRVAVGKVVLAALIPFGRIVVSPQRSPPSRGSRPAAASEMHYEMGRSVALEYLSALIGGCGYFPPVTRSEVCLGAACSTEHMLHGVIAFMARVLVDLSLVFTIGSWPDHGLVHVAGSSTVNS